MHRGTYSKRLRLSIVNDQRLNRDIELFLRKSINGLIYFAMSPANPAAETGNYFIELRLAALRNVTKGFYPV